MGKFRVEITDEAKVDISKHFKSGNKSTIKKIEQILIELELHPFSGSGQPEELRHELQGFWSRRINQKDRMIYSVDKTIVPLRSSPRWDIIEISDVRKKS
jgi:toxin YoeB